MRGRLEVCEIFRSLQGEGPSAGRPATFLRLRRCNLGCEFCDTRWTWDKNDPDYNNFRLISPEEIWNEVQGSSLLVVSGGEPMIWKGLLGTLFDQLPLSVDIEIETNGTISPLETGYERVYFNISPKLSNSGNGNRIVERPTALYRFVALSWRDRAIFKFVIASLSDLDEVEGFVRKYRISRDKVWLMPQGTTKEAMLEILPWLFDAAAGLGFNVTPRLHVLAFNNRRGV